MVVLEQSAQPFATADRSLEARCWPGSRREQKHIAFALMIPLPMKMRQVFAKRTPQGNLTEEDKL